MPFEWDEIQKDWLYGIPVSYPKKEIVKAFNRVESRFGSQFFDTYKWIRGNYIVTLIVDLSKVLEETEKGLCRLPEKGEIVQKIKSNDLYLASTLIRLAAHYTRHSLFVEFDPELLGKQPDLRVKFKGKWIYIEESKLDVSLRQKQIFSIMDSISNVMQTISSNINVEVFLLKEDLHGKEVNEITSRIIDLCYTSTQPQNLKIRNIAQILTYMKGQQKPSLEETRPSLGMATLVVGGGFERHLNIQVPFTDVRIEKILKERKQLSPKETNMIILDISMPGNLNAWSKSIKEILKSKRLRRVSAVLLIEKAITVKSLKVRTELVVHSNPSKFLPNEFIQLTNEHFKQSREYYYRPF